MKKNESEQPINQPSVEDLFKQLMKNSPIFVFFKDNKARSIQLSSNYEKMIGKPLQELLGKTMDDMFPSDLAKTMVADDLRVLKSGKSLTIEEEHNGRFYTTTKFPIIENGKPPFLAGYTIDITENKKAEAALKASQDLLETGQKALEEKNIALKEVLKQIESEKKGVERNIAINVEKVLLPIIDKLKKKSTSLEAGYLKLLEKYLKDIASPFIEKLSVKYSHLTPRELEVSKMIKNGLSSKEIADLLNISTQTVHRYREYIRRKLGIANKRISLTTYLNTDTP